MAKTNVKIKKPAKVVKPVKAANEKLNLKLKKDEGFVCVGCGYTGHGVVDEDTHLVTCPECGANLEENDILHLKSPGSYEGEDDDFKDDVSLDDLDSRLII